MRFVGPSLAFVFAVGCGSCGEELRVEGDHPYVRCVQVEPEESEWESGGLSFAVDGRELQITGEVPSAVAFALTPGAELGELPEAPLRIVLGGFARDAASAERLLTALAEKGPTLLLPGGEDDTAVMDDTLSEVDSLALVDLRGIHRVRFGGHEWVPVPGALDGRYARGDDACGFSADDLAKLDLPDPEAPRHLLTWAAPVGAGPLARGLEGVGVGQEALDTFAERVGAKGALFAWPRREVASDHALAEGVTHVAVPVWGRIVEGPDGSWTAGGVAVLELEEGALHLAR